MTFSVDIETYSSVSLPDCGVYKYVESPDFDILIFGYAIDDEEPIVLDLTKQALPQEVIDMLLDPAYEKWAFNASFERTCLTKYLGKYMDPEQWHCTMVLSYELGLPGSLEKVGEAVKLPEEDAKKKIGKQLIRYFSVPCKPTKANGGRTRNLPDHDPEKWALYLDYNKNDVVAERAIRKRLERFKVHPSEHDLWVIDQHINDRGVRVDRALAEGAGVIDEMYKAELLQQARELTGLENPNSNVQIKSWIAEQSGITVESLGKEAIAEVRERLSNYPQCLELLDIRSGLAKSSVAKYSKMTDMMCADDHVRGATQFYGAARTGRWAGRGIQLQNLSKNKMDLRLIALARQYVSRGDMDGLRMVFDEDPSNILSQLVRTSFIPEEGEKFVVADFSAIEARVLAWLAGEQWVLDSFAAGKDIYCETASQMFKVPVEKHGANSHLRSKGKVAVLACGYGGSVGALVAMGALKMGLKEEELLPIVQDWRNASPNIVKYWWDLDRKLRHCINTRSKVPLTRGMTARMEGPLLRITLPSGRDISYVRPKAPQGSDITYEGTMQMTGKWGDVKSWGGKIVENCLARGTNVLTKRGGIPIENILPDDEVWDGVEWVHHEGLIFKGVELVIWINGLLMTPEHKVLTDVGMVECQSAAGLLWSGGGRVVVSEGHTFAEVYDLKNCGPRHRFGVLDGDDLRIVSNCTQAVARDCLATSMANLEKAGYHVRFHIHDECVISCPKDTPVSTIEDLMSIPPDWAEGLPLRAAGYDGEFYFKD